MKRIFTLCIALTVLHHVSMGQSTWLKISTGAEFSSAIRSDGSLWLWGSNLNGQIANGEIGQTAVTEPFKLEGSNWVDVSCGAAHVIAIKDDGSLWGWGSNGVGQISGEAESNVLSPFLIDDEFEWLAIDAGQGHTLAIRSDSTLWGWGFNAFKQVTGTTSNNVLELFEIDDSRDWVDIAAGGAHSLGLRSDGSIWGWGLSANGQIGPIEGTEVLLPRRIGPDSLIWQSVSAGFEYSVAISEDGHLYALGFNGNGQLGVGDLQQRAAWTLVNDTTTWHRVNCGSAYCMAITEEGQLYGWGANLQGACGVDNNEANILKPLLVDEDITWTAVSAATGLGVSGSVFGFHTLALKEDSDFICATGANYIGQLGNGMTESISNFECETGVIETSVAHRQVHDVEVAIYPQPAVDECFVTVKDVFITSWRIMDVNGMVLAHTEENNADNINIDLSKWPSGNYILGLFTDKGLINKVIVKQ